MNEEWHLPPWVLREVSDDLRFTGGALAGLAQDEAKTLIRHLSVKP
jgi:CYTH domain-containing protein